MLNPLISLLFQKSGIIKLTFLTLDLVHSHLTEAACFGPMGHCTAWWNGAGGRGGLVHCTVNRKQEGVVRRNGALTTPQRACCQ